MPLRGSRLRTTPSVYLLLAIGLVDGELDAAGSAHEPDQAAEPSDQRAETGAPRATFHRAPPSREHRDVPAVPLRGWTGHCLHYVVDVGADADVSVDVTRSRCLVAPESAADYGRGFRKNRSLSGSMRARYSF